MGESNGFRVAPLVLGWFLLSGCATYQPGLSDTAQSADTLTTAIGLYGSTAAVEANPALAPLVSHPAGLVAVGALKVGAMHGARQLQSEDCERLIALGTGLGFGLTANNLAVILGGAPFIALTAGWGTGVATYQWSKTHNAVTECRNAIERPIPDFPELRAEPSPIGQSRS